MHQHTFALGAFDSRGIGLLKERMRLSQKGRNARITLHAIQYTRFVTTVVTFHQCDASQ